MPSVDVVSKVDLQALDNATNNVKREIATRYDFKNVKSEITLDRREKCIHIVSADDHRVKSIIDILIGLLRRLADQLQQTLGRVFTIGSLSAEAPSINY